MSTLLDTGQVVFLRFYWLRWSKTVNPPCIQISLRTDREGMVDDIMMHGTWHQLGIKILSDSHGFARTQNMWKRCFWLAKHMTWLHGLFPTNHIIIKIAQTTQNSWNFLVEKSSLLNKWQTLGDYAGKISYREIHSKIWSLWETRFNLSTMATFFCSQGVHCGVVQFILKSTLEPRSDAEIFMSWT